MSYSDLNLQADLSVAAPNNTVELKKIKDRAGKSNASPKSKSKPHSKVNGFKSHRNSNFEKLAGINKQGEHDFLSLTDTPVWGKLNDPANIDIKQHIKMMLKNLARPVFWGRIFNVISQYHDFALFLNTLKSRYPQQKEVENETTRITQHLNRVIEATLGAYQVINYSQRTVSNEMFNDRRDYDPGKIPLPHAASGLFFEYELEFGAICDQTQGGDHKRHFLKAIDVCRNLSEANVEISKALLAIKELGSLLQASASDLSTLERGCNILNTLQCDVKMNLHILLAGLDYRKNRWNTLLDSTQRGKEIADVLKVETKQKKEFKASQELEQRKLEITQRYQQELENMRLAVENECQGKKQELEQALKVKVDAIEAELGPKVEHLNKALDAKLAFLKKATQEELGNLVPLTKVEKENLDKAFSKDFATKELLVNHKYTKLNPFLNENDDLTKRFENIRELISKRTIIERDNKISKQVKDFREKLEKELNKKQKAFETELQCAGGLQPKAVRGLLQEQFYPFYFEAALMLMYLENCPENLSYSNGSESGDIPNPALGMIEPNTLQDLKSQRAKFLKLIAERALNFFRSGKSWDELFNCNSYLGEEPDPTLVECMKGKKKRADLRFGTLEEFLTFRDTLNHVRLKAQLKDKKRQSKGPFSQECASLAKVAGKPWVDELELLKGFIEKDLKLLAEVRARYFDKPSKGNESPKSLSFLTSEFDYADPVLQHYIKQQFYQDFTLTHEMPSQVLFCSYRGLIRDLSADTSDKSSLEEIIQNSVKVRDIILGYVLPFDETNFPEKVAKMGQEHQQQLISSVHSEEPVELSLEVLEASMSDSIPCEETKQSLDLAAVELPMGDPFYFHDTTHGYVGSLEHRLDEMPYGRTAEMLLEYFSKFEILFRQSLNRLMSVESLRLKGLHPEKEFAHCKPQSVVSEETWKKAERITFMYGRFTEQASQAYFVDDKLIKHNIPMHAPK